MGLRSPLILNSFNTITIIGTLIVSGNFEGNADSILYLDAQNNVADKLIVTERCVSK